MLTKTHSKNHINIKISKLNLIAGIFIWLSYSLLLYSLLYLSREVFRIFSKDFAGSLWILNDEEVNFYNLFFAYISTIISMNISIQFLLDRPKKYFSRNNIAKHKIINDQRVLSWYFLSWFSKLAIVFGILFGCTFWGGFYVFSFYPEYNYLFVLIIIVLFLQSFTTLSLKVKTKGIKLILLMALIVSIISFSISRINLVDYKKINKVFLNNDIYHKYSVDIPETLFFEKHYRYSNTEDIYLVSTNVAKSDSLAIIFDSENIKLHDFHDLLTEIKFYYHQQIPTRSYLRLHIDRTIKMGLVNIILKQLSNAGIRLIEYAVVPKNREYNKRYYNKLSIYFGSPYFDSDLFPFEVINESFNEVSNIIELKIKGNNSFYWNNLEVKPLQLKNKITEAIHKDPNYLIKFYIYNDVSFDSYITVVSTAIGVINEFRENESFNLYSKKYKELNYGEKNTINAIHRLHMFQITEEMFESFPLQVQGKTN